MTQLGAQLPGLSLWLYSDSGFPIPRSVQAPHACSPGLDAVARSMSCMVVDAGVDLKNSHNLKVEDYVLLVGIFRTLSPGDSTSNDPERIAVKRDGGGASLYRSLQQRAGSEHQKYFVN